MLFDNPDALWLLPLLPVMLMGLAYWGWKRKKEIAGILALDPTPLRRKQIEKYITATLLTALLVFAMALPKVASSSFAPPEKAGEIALLVDVSGSMAARKDANSPSRLQRVKTMLHELVDHLEELGHPKVSLHGFTNIARSLVPFIGSEDYGYLRESISQLLEIYAVPGQGSVLGQSILDVTGKFTPDGTVKVILLFSDGEPFIGATRALRDQEKQLIEQAIQKANQAGITVITIGVGEHEGAKIPVYDAQGQFTGTYAKIEGGDYVSYLQEEQLKDIATRTGGRYLSENNRGDLIPLIRDRLATAASYSAGKEIRVYQSLAPWILMAALPIWILFARRHWLA